MGAGLGLFCLLDDVEGFEVVFQSELSCGFDFTVVCHSVSFSFDFTGDLTVEIFFGLSLGLGGDDFGLDSSLRLAGDFMSFLRLSLGFSSTFLGLSVLLLTGEDFLAGDLCLLTLFSVL
jgi:hypothetical protein